MQAVDEDRAVRRVHGGGQHGALPVPRLPLRQRMLRVLPVYGMVPAVQCTVLSATVNSRTNAIIESQIESKHARRSCWSLA